MSNHISRYTARYQRMVHPDTVTSFPRHVFKRSANLQTDEKN